MEGNPMHEREVRAARNQSLFRAINEKLIDLSEAFAAFAGDFQIACECADTFCLASLTIAPEAYEEVRSQANRFVVLPGHIVPEVEKVVAEEDGYVVVEKIALAAEIAETLDPRGE
jgi:hypothetical protein